MSAKHLRSVRATGLILFVLFVSTSNAQISSLPRPAAAAQRADDGGVRLRPGSPLAATARAVFAVAESSEQIVSRPVNLSEPWRVFPVEGKFDRIAGLAAQGDALYVADASNETIDRIDLETGKRQRVYNEGPLQDPSSIAVARDLFVADSGKVFRLRANGIRQVALDKETTLGGRLFLAGSGDDLFIASPADGRISELSGIGSADPETSGQLASSSGKWREMSSKQSRADSLLRYTVQKRAFPDIQQPSQIAIWKGVIYVVDAQDRSLYMMGRTDQRPVRLVRNEARNVRPEKAEKAIDPGGLAVNDSSVLLLNGGELERWPRVVPAEVHLRLTSVSEAMVEVYHYLYRHDILPLRQVAIEQNVDFTLKKHRAWPPHNHYPEKLTPLLCRINPGLCAKDATMRYVQAGQRIWIPDLYSENYVDGIELPVDKLSLGEEADQNVKSPEFNEWKSEDRLRVLNEAGLAKAPGITARDLRGGMFIVPVEYIRFLVPCVAADCTKGGALEQRLSSSFPGSKVLSQEERRAASAVAAHDTTATDTAAPDATATQPPANPATPAPDSQTLNVSLADLKAKFTTMLEKVSFFALPQSPQHFDHKVGVAEEFFDRDHPDLSAAWVPGATSQPVPAGGGAPQPGDSFRIRSFQKADHGTMVAGLIGARQTAFEQKGLAPRARLVSLLSPDPAIGEEIRRAFLDGVRIFNISAHYKENIIPSALQDAIVQRKTALFVVAAGNDVKQGSSRELCDKLSVFPACWHEKPNVIVVTATNANADGMLLPTERGPGANWSGTAVHIAAPGEGYYAPANERSYAPVHGSSFATPLVTATAALLYAQRVFDPFTIKQRLIATADPNNGLDDKVLGGVLNMKRALSDLPFGVLTRSVRNPTGPPTIETERVVVDAGKITIRKVDGRDREILVADLRRLHRYGGALRVVFLDDEGKLIVLEGASFTDEKHAQFDATSESGAVVSVNLNEWDDYVGPIPVL